jgi:hypothetical protein
MTEIKCYCGHTINCDCVPLKKQTAVEWLATYLKGITSLNCDEVIEQAKAMEKQQIIDAYETAMETDIYNEPLKVGKQYYKETFIT